MEILILGIIVVVLMAYVSTKLKKNSADAFKAETAETEEFFIYKPEGYIIPWNEISAFKAHSKETGAGAADKLDQSWAELRIFENKDFETVCREAAESVEKVVSEEKAQDDALNYCFMHAKASEKGAAADVFYKIVESTARQKVYELKVSVLSDAMESYSSKASEMLQSFQVK